MSILDRLAASALLAGMDTLEVEYKDGHEQVTALKGAFGYGLARFRSGSAEARALRDELRSVSRRTMFVSIQGREYALRARVYDSFGERAYRIELRSGARPGRSGRSRRRRS